MCCLGYDQQDLAWVLTKRRVSYVEIRRTEHEYLGPYAALEVDRLRRISRRAEA
ncbi:MAG TPA: hypothetical protein VGM88_10060 [Kofleriaceae bacterium]|jgi:hypothetical protein